MKGEVCFTHQAFNSAVFGSPSQLSSNLFPDSTGEHCEAFSNLPVRAKPEPNEELNLDLCLPDDQDATLNECSCFSVMIKGQTVG